MPNLARKLKILFPDIDFHNQCRLFDDGEGDGPYIKEWNRAEPKPVQQDIDAVTDQQVDDDVKDEDADIQKQFSPTLKAFAMVMLDEINILRTTAGLPVRTPAQFKAAVRAKL
jgi:hypothetical protein